MRNLFLCVVVAGAGCSGFAFEDSCADDPAANHAVVNPATGDCWVFESSCDVPGDWLPCDAPAQCDEERACPPDRICVDGTCEPVESGCDADDDCPLSQHCDLATAACVDNATCLDDTDCPDGQHCDRGSTAGECDPSVPGCGAVYLCARGWQSCAVSADCDKGEVCPAESGGPAACQPSCTADVDCGGGLVCTAEDGVCLEPADADAALPCHGWCETPSVACDHYTDCASGEGCPGVEIPGAPLECRKGCIATSECAAGETCKMEGCMDQVQPFGPGAPLVCLGYCGV